MSDLSSDGGGSASASRTLQRLEGCCEDSFPVSRRADDDAVADELSVFKALANGNRLRILEALRDGELCVCELEAVLEAPQSTVASHLSRLREAGLVRARRDGKWTHYRIADTATLQLLDLAAAVGDAE